MAELETRLAQLDEIVAHAYALRLALSEAAECSVEAAPDAVTDELEALHSAVDEVARNRAAATLAGF